MKISTILLAGLVGIAAACSALAADVSSDFGPKLAAAGKPSAELTAFRKAIAKKYAEKVAAWERGDYESIVSKFYAKDVVTVGELEGMYIGRDAIRPGYVENVKKYTAKVDSVNSYVNGNAGWDWADFIVTPRGAKDSITLAMVFLWAKENGDWICKGESFVFGSLRRGSLEPMHPEDLK